MKTTGSPITDAERQQVADWLIAEGKTPSDTSRYTIAKHFGYTDRRARTIHDELKFTWEKWSKPAAVADSGEAETHDMHGNAWTISMPRTRICSVDQLIEHCSVDLEKWEVERFVVNKWEVGAKDANSEIQVHPLFQVKAWLKKRTQVIAARAEIDAMLAEIRSAAPLYPPTILSAQPAGNMLELSFPDLHIGKLAWGQETGWEDYDSGIAERTYREAFTALLDRTATCRYDRVCLVVGNDLLNADNLENTTTRGTPQSCDTRHPRSFQIARRLNIWAIEQAMKVAPVDVVMIPGNHDTNTVFYLGEVLDAWFHNAKNVQVDNRPTLRKLYRFGKVALMFTHGDKGKRKDYPLLMATEHRKAWGDAEFCEIHTGDKHQVRLEEQYGVRVRILPSLCASDAWHSAEGYVGNIRSAEAYKWNAETGLMGIEMYTAANSKRAA